MAAAVRASRGRVDGFEILAVGRAAYIRRAIPEKGRDVTDGPIEHTGQFDDEIQLRNAGSRHELGWIPAQRPGQLLAGATLVRLSQIQKLLETLPPDGFRVHGGHPSLLSCAFFRPLDPSPYKASGAKRSKNCLFSSPLPKGNATAKASPVKPFVLLEAFDSCGERRPLYPASRIADEPLTIDLPSRDWRPENYDHRYRGTVTARLALAESLNVPTVRVARWCGFAATASVFSRIGFDLPADPPPSFVLGSLETTPLELARAYTVIAAAGKLLTPFAIRRLEKPEGRKLDRNRPHRRRVVDGEAAYLVRDVMKSAVAEGTAAAGRLEGLDVAAKTGSSSALRDAWFAGHAGSLVAVVWIGLDDSAPLGLTGASAAGPLWREFMKAAVPARPGFVQQVPKGIVEDWVDPMTGLRVSSRNQRARKEIFRRGALPPRNRFWRVDRSVPVVD